jgi:hypothetical protein
MEEDQMKSPSSPLSRRRFLFAAGAGSVATAAAVATRTATDAPRGKPEAATSGKGYHVTEHIRKYYNTAKV